MRTILGILSACGLVVLVLGVSVAVALPAARVFVNVKVSATAERDTIVLANSFCAERGFDRAASFDDALVVPSMGYARFAQLRCQAERAGDAVTASN
jgi:hypothetical protein